MTLSIDRQNVANVLRVVNRELGVIRFTTDGFNRQRKTKAPTVETVGRG